MSVELLKEAKRWLLEAARNTGDKGFAAASVPESRSRSLGKPSRFLPTSVRQDTHRIPPATPQFELLGANFTHWQSPPSQGSPSSGVRLLRQNSPVHEGALQSPFLSSDYGNTRLRATI